MFKNVNGGGISYSKLLQGNYGFIGTEPDTLYRFGNGKYTEFSGQEIVAENCVKARVKDLVVEGKTYQNLVGKVTYMKPSWSVTDEGYKCVAGESFESISFEGVSLLKANQTYTIVVDILKNTLVSTVMPLKIVLASNTQNWGNADINLNQTGRFIAKLTSLEIVVDSISIVRRACTEGEIIISNFIILEGDYTNTDLPTSIDGIESVAEKENNILGLKVNDVVSSVELPIPLRSLPNGIADTIEGDKVVQRVGKVVLENIKDYNIADQIKNNNRIGIMVGNVLDSSTKKPIISDHFFDLSNGGESVNGSFSYGGRIFLYLGLSTLEEYVEWFKGNTTTFYYSLSEPIIHDLEVPSISTVRGANIITTENNIKPKLKLKVKVK